jgi:hypothetical protein
MRLLPFATVLLVGLSIGAASAAQSAVTAGQLTAAKELMALTHAEDNTRAVAKRLEPRVVETLKSRSPAFAAHQTEFEAEYTKELESGLPIAMNTEANYYAQHYSEDELRQLISFYKTPLGQKILSEGGKLTSELEATALVWSTQAGIRALQAVMPTEQTKGQTP